MATTNASFAALAHAFLTESWRLNPVSATALGIHAYDHLLPDMTPDGIGASNAVLRGLLESAEAVDPTTLTQVERIEREVILATLRRSVRDCAELREFERAPHVYTDIASRAIFPLISRNFAPHEERMVSVRDRLHLIPELLTTAQNNLSDEAAASSCNIASRAATGAVRFLNTAIPPEAERVGGALGDEVLVASKEAAAALDGFGKFASDLETRTRGTFATGREYFDFLLRDYHLVDHDATTLHEWGEQLASEYEAELERVAHQIDPDRSWPEIIEEIKLDGPAADELVGAYGKEMRIARQAVLDYDVATIPAGETCDVDWLPEFLRPIAPIAIFNSTPLFDPEDRSIWLVTPIDQSWPAERQAAQLRDHNWVFLRTIAMHETYPGHHLQPVHAKRQPSNVLRGSRFTQFSEGWGLYTEEVFWDVGFLADPKLRLWQLKHALWRAVRLIVDTGIHTRGMSVEDAADQLESRVKLERPTAIGEITRYTTAPGQPSSYMLGKEQMVRLREACRVREGNSFSLRRFHDRLLSYGSIPMRLIRDDMLSDRPLYEERAL